MTVRAETATTHLGRYRVVKRLAHGGMADVLLARTDGFEGFARHVVIKRIHPELLVEPRYVKMFLDEARLAAALHHHNIVQVNDVGREAGEYFFAMEYVHGEDARHLLIEASKRGTQIPLDHVLTIICSAAAGLHHAHEQRTSDGEPLGIVHRDVSPANILVGFDGCVKVADFGIALAAHRAEQTQSGVLKGKVAYMSPEQCNCERVDRRSDVFSLGVCLYELATVHPCFVGRNDFVTMSNIVEGRYTPPSHLSASIDLALQAIIGKALAIDPAARYQTTDELRLALEAYADRAGLRISTSALADYMKQQFGTRELPWQTGGELEVVVPLAPITKDDDDDLAIAIEVNPEPLAIAIESAPPAPAQRPIKTTLPLRALQPAAPVTSPRRPAPVASPLRSTRGIPAATRLESRQIWMIGAVVAVAIATLCMWLAIRSRESAPAKPPAAASPRPRIAPLPAPSFESPAATAPAIPVAPAATTRRRKTEAEIEADYAAATYKRGERGQSAAPAPEQAAAPLAGKAAATPAAKAAAPPAAATPAAKDVSPSATHEQAAPEPAATPKWDPDVLFPQ